MSAFAIFAVVLTFAYAIYYAVVIFMDMTRNEGQKSEMEDIDIPGMASKVPDEPPTEVVETEDGRYAIPKSGEGANADNAGESKTETSQKQPDQQPTSTGSASADKPAAPATSGNTADKVIQKLENEMHPVPVESEAEFFTDEMLGILGSGRVTPAGQQIHAKQMTYSLLYGYGIKSSKNHHHLIIYNMCDGTSIGTVPC